MKSIAEQMMEDWERTDKWATGVMNDIVKDVAKKSDKIATPSYGNYQGSVDFNNHGTYDADGNLVCGVYK